MTTEASLIADCVAAPDDDAPRQVYADWLMQRGDPLGEYIAIQCLLAKAWDSDTVLPDEPAVAERERELRDAHLDRWIEPHRYLVTGALEMRRGFVEHVVVLRTTDLLDPKLLFQALPMLRALTVPEPAIPDNRLEAVPPQIEELSLGEPGYVSVEAVTRLVTSEALSKLVKLRIVNARLAPEAVDALLAIPRPLVALDLDLNRQYTDFLVDSRAVIARIATMRSLRELGLSNIDLETLPDLAHLDLRRISLAYCTVDIRVLRALVARWPNLTTIELQYAQLSNNLVTELLSAGPAIRRLRISACKLASAHVVNLAESPHARSLRRLDLRNEPGKYEQPIADDAIARLLAGLPDVVDLRLDRSSRHRPYRGSLPRYPRLLLDEIVANRKIPAIKIYRELTNAGLAEAKLAVERIMFELS